MVVLDHIESATNFLLNKERLSRICTALSLQQTDGERRKQGKNVQTIADKMRYLFLQLPDVSLLFPTALKCDKLIILLQAETCDETQNRQRNYKQNNNKTMGYFIITDSNWARLRDEILNLAETCHKAFGEQSKHTDWLHNGDVCKLLNISKRTLQHYRDTGVLPFSQIGHKCYYKREDVEQLLQTKTEKSKTDKTNINK